MAQQITLADLTASGTANAVTAPAVTDPNAGALVPTADQAASDAKHTPDQQIAKLPEADQQQIAQMA